MGSVLVSIPPHAIHSTYPSFKDSSGEDYVKDSLFSSSDDDNMSDSASSDSPTSPIPAFGQPPIPSDDDDVGDSLPCFVDSALHRLPEIELPRGRVDKKALLLYVSDWDDGWMRAHAARAIRQLNDVAETAMIEEGTNYPFFRIDPTRVSLTLSKSEIAAKRRAYREKYESKPEVKARRAAQREDPKYKEKRRIRMKSEDAKLKKRLAQAKKTLLARKILKDNARLAEMSPEELEQHLQHLQLKAVPVRQR